MATKNKPKEKGSNAKNWTLLGGLAAALIVFLGWQFAISPLLDTVYSASEKISAAQDNLFSQTVKLAKIKAIKNTVDLTANLDQLNSSIPPEIADADFLAQVQKIVNDNGVAVGKITIDTKTSVKTGLTIPYPVIIAGTGDPENVFGFIQGLQKLNRLVVINSIALDTAKEETKFTINATIYALPKE